MTGLKIKTKSQYFAASNSYKGFRNHFSEFFNPQTSDRIFIIKGGPGTGKSCFMKRLESLFTKQDLQTTAILCSSDLGSLDGLTVRGRRGSFSILDGTAPHATDTVMPGALDEIIDLGSCWNDSWLTAHREVIEKLNTEKANACKVAYGYLKIAGVASEEIKSNALRCFDKKSAINRIKSLAENELDCKDGGRTLRFISSFSKDGLYRLDTLSNIYSNRISVGGESVFASIFVTHLSEYMRSLELEHFSFPSVPDNEVSEAVAVGDGAVYVTDKEDYNIDANEYFKRSPVNEEEIKIAKIVQKDALAEAKRWFGIAADMHFSLEDIYSEAMDFDKIDSIFEVKYGQMQNILN